MESKGYKYRLTQKSNNYVLSTSVQGDEIKITLANSSNPTSVITKTFSVETWKRIGAIFESIQTPIDAIQWIDKTLKGHKVKIVEEGTLVKLVFYIIENKTKHLVQIPLSGGEQTNSSINKYN